MKRGDIVTVSLQGDYGKPRPALIVQTEGKIGKVIGHLDHKRLSEVNATLAFLLALTETTHS